MVRSVDLDDADVMNCPEAKNISSRGVGGGILHVAVTKRRHHYLLLLIPSVNITLGVLM